VRISSSHPLIKWLAAPQPQRPGQWLSYCIWTSNWQPTSKLPCSVATERLDCPGHSPFT
jgi:hypothetical protein